MKILQVNKYYSPVIGGVETVCKQYSENLAKDHDITVLCIKKELSFSNSIELINGVKIFRCRSWGSFFSMPISLSFIFHFIRLALTSNTIFVHLPCPLIDLALLFTPIKKQKLILVWHSDIVRQKKLKKLLYFLFVNTLNKASKILVTSPNLIHFSQYLQAFERKCEVLPLSVDCNKIEQLLSASKSELSADILANKNIDALFLGRISSYKGVNVLIESLLLLKNKGLRPKVLIVGGGELSQEVMSELIDKKLSNVSFINRFISEKEKYYLLDKAKCFVFPSTEPSEAFGITQLEAMYLQTPVINTNLKSGVPWVSQHRITGLTIDPNDALALASAIQELLSDSALREQLAEGAMKRVKSEFDNIKILRRLMEIIH